MTHVGAAVKVTVTSHISGLPSWPLGWVGCTSQGLTYRSRAASSPTLLGQTEQPELWDGPAAGGPPGGTAQYLPQ